MTTSILPTVDVSHIDSTDDDPSLGTAADWTPRSLSSNDDSSRPIRAEYDDAEVWLADTADYLAVDQEILRRIALEWTHAVECEWKRRILTLAFTHHLERRDEGDCARITIRFRSSDAPTIRYQYLANGRNGGAHYLQSLTPQRRAMIRSLAVEEGFWVLAEGETYLSIALETPSVRTDVALIERILTEVFDNSLAAIDAIDEVLDRDRSRSWLTMAD